MRQQRNARMSTPAPMYRAAGHLPAAGFASIVDGQAKKDFDARDQALKAARELTRSDDDASMRKINRNYLRDLKG
jgi:hypothetical protein